MREARENEEHKHIVLIYRYFIHRFDRSQRNLNLRIEQLQAAAALFPRQKSPRRLVSVCSYEKLRVSGIWCILFWWGYSVA